MAYWYNKLKIMSEKFKKDFLDSHADFMSNARKTIGDPEKLNPLIEFGAIREMCEGNAVLEKLFSDMENYSEKYVETLAKYQELINQDVDRDIKTELAKLDQDSRIVHDAAIDSVNILSRNMEKFGKNGSWIEKFNKSRALFGRFMVINIYKELASEEKKYVTK